MSAVVDFDFEVPPSCEAHEPPEARGLARDEVRLMVADARRRQARARALPRAAALPARRRPGRRQHVRARFPRRSPRPGRTARRSSCGSRRRCRTAAGSSSCGSAPSASRPARSGERLALPGGARAELLAPLRRQPPALGRRRSHLPEPLDRYLAEHGRPIRYGYVSRQLAARRVPERLRASSPAAPSRRAPGRPFTRELLTRLVAKGRPGRAARAAHRRLVAGARRAARTRSGTACRRDRRASSTPSTAGAAASSRSARRSCARSRRSPRRTAAVASGEGWTSLVITPERGVRAVDGLITGLHEPRASHLDLLEAVAGERAARAVVPGRARARLPLARVRRQPADPAVGQRGPRPGSAALAWGCDGRSRGRRRTRARALAGRERARAALSGLLAVA